MQEKTYNGWTNYTTWRVNLEVFDGINLHDMDWPTDVVFLVNVLRDYVEEYIWETTSEGIARDYALAFVSDTNWHEIAKHMIDAYAEV